MFTMIITKINIVIEAIENLSDFIKLSLTWIIALTYIVSTLRVFILHKYTLPAMWNILFGD